MKKSTQLILILAGLVAVLLGGAPAYATEVKADSCAAYVFRGTQTTLCGQFPGNTDRDCPEIGKPVDLVKKGSDPWALDNDKDGRGCDDVSTSPSPSPSKTTVKPSPSKTTKAPTATPSRTRTGKPTPSRSTSSAAVSGPTLPKTGAPGGLLTGLGILSLVGGALAVWAVRTRRTRFES